jgi:uroporphyrinogen-III synthase
VSARALSASAPAARSDGPGLLAGYTVAVTAARRRDELGTMLERRGARVVYAPAIRVVALHDDAQLRKATEACLDAPVDVAVATTGIGFRSWMEAADGWGSGERLRSRLAAGTILTRGPKARGAVRAAGLADEWSPASESSEEVLRHLLEQPLEGRRVAVQLHGEPLAWFVEALRHAGAEVVEVPVYRCIPADDLAPVRRLVELTVGRQVDVVSFTSAPAVSSVLQVAWSMGLGDEFVESLRASAAAVCVGTVTASRLDALGVPTHRPERARLGALVREIDAVAPRRARAFTVGSHRVEIRGHAAVLDGTLVPLAPAPMAVLRALATRPGHVCSRAELLRSLPSRTAADGHAVEMAVNRLRVAFGDVPVVQTVVKRGYRLTVDRDADAGHSPGRVP